MRGIHVRIWDSPEIWNFSIGSFLKFEARNCLEIRGIWNFLGVWHFCEIFFLIRNLWFLWKSGFLRSFLEIYNFGFPTEFESSLKFPNFRASITEASYGTVCKLLRLKFLFAVFESIDAQVISTLFAADKKSELSQSARLRCQFRSSRASPFYSSR